jgi:cation transport protein ChaC
MNPRRPALTPEIVARVEREEPDCGPDPDMTYLEGEDFSRAADAILAQNPGAPLWLFAYGSLMWKPAHDPVEARLVRVHGWRRSFCLDIRRWRATPDEPGLMMALARGGCCTGMAYRLGDSDLRGQMVRLLEREVSTERGLAAMRWVRCHAGGDRFRALAFYTATAEDHYIHLPLRDQARRLARAAGHLGSGAAYLHNTLTHLADMGVHDSYLWRLQELVAEEILSMPPLAPPR